MSKNSRLIAWFSEYCREHPKERFWQALRNWSKKDFILFSLKPPHEATEEDLTDTFPIE